MRIMRGKIFLGLMFIVLGGCTARQLTTGGSCVSVISNPKVIEGCEHLGQVKGEDHFSGGVVGQGVSAENAMASLRNKAFALGANMVLVREESIVISGSKIKGDAYYCRER